jgi:Kef-type K+ transport system membrane component KefB
VHVSFTSLAIVAAVAFAAPLALGLVPAVRLPAVVLEIVLGIVVGPALLGWVKVDDAVEVMSLLGLAFLLLLSGLEVQFDMLRGRLLRITSLGFPVSFAVAVAAGLILDAADVTGAPLLIAIMLSATSLGVVIPVLEDAGEASTQFGQIVIAAASIADIATIVLLSLFFSRESSGVGAKLVLLGDFALLIAAVGVAVARFERSMHISAALLRLQDTTAQIRVRGAFVAGQIGMDLGLISEATGAALIAAGLLSVLLFPVAALALLRYASGTPSPSRSASQAA